MRTLVFRLLLLGAQLASGCAHLDEDLVYGATPPGYVSPGFPATITEEIPDSALPSNGMAEALAESTLNLLGSFFHHTAAQVERPEPRARRVVVAPAPVVQPVPATRAQKPRPRSQAKRVAHDRPKAAQHKPAVNKSSSPKASKKKK